MITAALLVYKVIHSTPCNQLDTYYITLTQVQLFFTYVLCVYLLCEVSLMHAVGLLVGADERLSHSTAWPYRSPGLSTFSALSGVYSLSLAPLS